MEELYIIDAKYRIRKFLEKYGESCYLSFSGGKDSTVLAHLIQSVQEEDFDIEIPFVFCNTGLELPYTIDFVKKFKYNNKVTVSPKMKFTEVFKKYGRPVISKSVDDRLMTYQNKLKQGYSKERATDYEVSARASQLVGKHKKWKTFKLPKRDMWTLDTNIVISNQCCNKLKKDPLKKYAKDNSMKACFMGVRTSESLLRKANYKSCFKEGKDYDLLTPIYDWNDYDIENYIKKFNLKISEAYTLMGFNRTGCHLCPYNWDIESDLATISNFHPKLHNYIWDIMGDIYESKGIKRSDIE